MLLLTQTVLVIAVLTCEASMNRERNYNARMKQLEAMNAMSKKDMNGENSVERYDLRADPQAEYEDETFDEELNIEGTNYGVQSFGVGTIVRLSYTPPSQKTWLLLNLISDSGDILLHINPRSTASGSVLALNSFLNGAWGREERPAGFPFNATTVHVVVAVENGGYRITANGGAFQYLYRHRRSFSLVTSMATEVDDIQYGVVVSPQTCSDDKIGKVINIRGVFPPSTDACVCRVNVILAPPSELAVRLVTATFPNIPLQFNPRPSAPHNAVIRNAFINGAWGTEEREGGMPFTPNSAYTLAIIMRDNQFEINVNGGLFATFQNRIRLSGPMTVLVTRGLFGSPTEVTVAQ